MFLSPKTGSQGTTVCVGLKLIGTGDAAAVNGLLVDIAPNVVPALRAVPSIRHARGQSWHCRLLSFRVACNKRVGVVV
jgi:hypothetical protein